MSEIKHDTTIVDILENYKENAETIIKQLHFKTNHGTTIGGFREDIWKQMFKQIIPKKFVIEQSVFIIDSKGKVSREVDLAIFDETYTPYIFHYGRIKFIPIEAVAVVVECKSSKMDENCLKGWADSIADLTTSLESYTRVAGRIIAGQEAANPTQTQTRPLRILCCMNQKEVKKSLNNKDALFDVIIRAPSEDGELQIAFDEGKANLKDWYLALNHAGSQQRAADRYDNNGESELEKLKLEDYQVKMKGSSVSLLSFNLQLNQLLMLINNPIPFPHRAYARMFNEYEKGGKTNE